MNNKDLQKYRIRYLSKTILIILGTLSFFTLLFYIFDVVFSGFIANILIGTNQAWADWMMDKKVSIMLGIMLLAIISAWLFSTIQTAKTLNLIVNSIDIVFNKDKSLISLPQDLRDVEQKLNSIKYEAIRNEQLAKAAEQRKNDLIVYLAHDLKTPLTSVLGYLVLLTDEKDISKDLEERYLNIALKKAQRLEELINEFFDIARFNLQNIHLEKSTIDVSVMLTQLQEELYPLYKTKSLKCKIAADSGLTIIADGDKLARVFSNLLKNAIAYSYENCEITIWARKEGEKIAISFANIGPKIPEHKLNSIFEKFYRLDTARSSQTGGAGLGLAIAKEIVELHNGEISAKSTAEFTEFTVFLPYERI